MPLLMSSRDASFWGIREKLGSRRCSLVSKNFRNISRSSFNPKGFGSRIINYLPNIDLFSWTYIDMPGFSRASSGSSAEQIAQIPGQVGEAPAGGLDPGRQADEFHIGVEGQIDGHILLREVA